MVAAADFCAVCCGTLDLLPDVADRYALNEFAQGFVDNGSRYEIVTAIEVAEHFANPRDEMQNIFGRSRSVCVLGTKMYEGQRGGLVVPNPNVWAACVLLLRQGPWRSLLHRIATITSGSELTFIYS